MIASSLVQLLDFVLAHRPQMTPLVPDRASLRALADRLPPLPCAGLELRLTPMEAGVTDLQLGLGDHAALRRLHDWLRTRWHAPSQTLPAGWTALRQALEDGLDDLPLRDLWLELDGGGHDPWPPLSLFLRLDPTADGRPLETQWLAWLDRLHAPPSPALEAGLRRCLAACSGAQCLTHLGWMPGRPGSPLRLIIEGCTWDTDAEYLVRAGWPGDPAAWRATLLPLQAEVDRWRLAISLHEDGTVAPTVGLECFLGDPAVHDPRWRRLLQQGVQQGWWTATAAATLNAWPGVLTPATAGPPWPDALLLDALLDGDDPPAMLDLRISHIKVRCDGHTIAGAKGYVGFTRVRPVAAPVVPAAPAPRRAPLEQPLEAAEHGLEFLLGARSPAGWWQDYDGFGEGVSDEWVTAFVACAVLACTLPGGQAAAARAWSLLAARGRQGWGWNAAQPPDADSTAWALRLAHALGRDGDDAALGGLAFLHDHLLADGPATGGVTTYERHHHAAHEGDPGCQPEWFTPHACVTAAVAGLAVEPGFSALRSTIDYLCRGQRPEGDWAGYWWPDAGYTTACATQALSADPGPASQAACERAARWARRSLTAQSTPLPSPFALALRLQVLLHAGQEADGTLLAQGAQQLLATQQPDGSWPAGAALAIPNRQGRIVPALDHRRTMTTAIVVQTITALSARGFA